MQIKLSRALMCSKSLEATFSVLYSSDDLGGYTGNIQPTRICRINVGSYPNFVARKRDDDNTYFIPASNDDDLKPLMMIDDDLNGS